MAKCTWAMRNGKRCGKPGEGNPSLCDRHYEQMLREADEDDEETEDDGSPGFFDSVVVEEIVDEVIEHPRVQGVFNKAGSLLDRFANLVDAAATGRRPQTPPPGPEPVGGEEGREQRRQQRQERREQRRPPPPPPPQNNEATEQRRRLQQAFMVFGWDPKKPYTEEEVKARKKALARVYHTDATNGSDEMMKRVNTAADTLIQALKK